MVGIFLVVWWVVLFAVLPWGVRSQEESGDTVPGTDPGAPTVPALLQKALWTTLIATLICGLLYWLQATRVITVENLLSLGNLLR
jgi:predicted secreted protein